MAGLERQIPINGRDRLKYGFLYMKKIFSDIPTCQRIVIDLPGVNSVHTWFSRLRNCAEHSVPRPGLIVLAD